MAIGQKDIFTNAIDLFSSDQEDLRVAAAFAAGKSCDVLFFSFHSNILDKYRKHRCRESPPVPSQHHPDGRKRCKEAAVIATCLKRST